MSISYFVGSHLGVDVKSLESGEGTSPLTLISATAISAGVVRVVFSQDILSTTEGHLEFPIPVFDPYNYVITRQTTGAVLRAIRIKKVSETTYDVYTNEQDDVWYDISIYNIYDVYGNKISSSGNSTSFYGITNPYLQLANEMRGFAAGYLGMDEFEVLDFIPDQGYPILQNQSPAPGDINVSQTTPIYLEIIDLDKGVDPTTVSLTIEGEYALLGGQQQEGYIVDQVVITSGFAYTIYPQQQFFEGSVVDIGVSAKDLAYLPMHLQTSYSFSTTGSPPYLQNQNPAPSAVDVPPYSPVIFELVDPNSGINISSVIIRVNGINAVINDVAQNGHSFTRTAVSGGWRYTVLRPEPFMLGIAGSVTVIADNGAEVPLSIDETYNFIVDDVYSYPSSSSIPYSVNVDRLDLVSQLKPKTVWNQFDEHGLTLSLQRLQAEENWQYHRRLVDAFVNIANSSYRGLVNGITRELGLSFSYPLSINPKVDSEGKFLAPDPYIIFDGAWVLLYSDFANNVLDYKVDRYQAGGNFEHLQRLVDLVNSSAFFTASLLAGADPYARTMTLLNQSNRVAVDIEDAQQSTRFKIQHNRIVNGSLTFSDKSIFRIKRASPNSVRSAGDYHVDLHSGLVTVASVPPVGTTMRYQYTIYPFKPVASPIVLCDINSENFRHKLFHQIIQDNGQFIHGLPNELGVDIINELMSVMPMYWGL